MTVFKKKLTSLVAFLLALLTVSSCGSIPGLDNVETSGDDTSSVEIVTTEDPSLDIVPEGILLSGPSVSTTCAVVYPSGATTIKDAAEAFAEYFTVFAGATFTAHSSTEDAPEEYKIVIKNDSSISSSYSVKLDGKTVNVSGKDTANTLEALSYLKLTALQGKYCAIPEGLDFSSGEGPAILTQYPEKYYYYEDVYTPTLIYTFETSNLDSEKSRLIVGGVDVTKKATWENGKVTLSGITVNAGDHTVLLSLAGRDGSVEVLETTFSCGDGSEMNLYAGELHAHTSDSDGMGTIEQAYAYARDVAKLDFFSVTDHSNSFKNETYQGSHLSNADNYNDPGTFVALYGYEQTYSASTYYGHLNTINYGSLTTRSTLLENYYSTMTTDQNSIVMFNHPGYRWGNFCEYEFWSEEFDKVVNLAEIKGKSYDSEYALSLTKGWHVSPLYNEDNHSDNWGNAYEYCGYALAPALTRQNIIEAFQKNRTYTTTDKTLKVYYKINGEWMGSRLDSPDKLKVSVTLSTEKPVGLGTVSLIGEDNIVVAQISLGRTKKYTWEFEIDPHYDYYYVKVESDKTWCVTAPIWIENREELTVLGLSQSLVTNAVTSNDQRITATIKNSSSTELTNAVVNFYLSSTAGFDITSAKSYATVKAGDIAAGKTIEIFADLPYKTDLNRVYAVVTAESDGKKYGAVKYTEISNIYFSEIVPKNLQGGTSAYEFIELYNNSNQTVNLFNYSIRYYAKPGAKADSLAENTWQLTGTIAPHSTLVLWFVSADNKLSIADFNKRYGTSLVGGKDIVMIVGNQLPDTNPVQLELLNGTKVISRCWFNWEGAADVVPDRAIIFNYPSNYTCTSRVEKARIAPTPGELVDGQMPKQVEK